MPDQSQLSKVLEGILQSAEMQKLNPELHSTTLAAASGLTTIKAESAFALSLVETGAITPTLIAREKANALKQGGLLEVIDHPTSLQAIGGLNTLKPQF